ncbi:tetratricopeptide repeat protein [Pseudobacteroides cellulosolvens]|uniref:Tetratricopeptide TPR_1 repeat-containing protein n=1 Tax=Pseudobacteroides cellulosolvens ATCC 35603 = DSM 2933 TaxID=398512 RepID=A0A0L6JKG8_9FIRM|nr:tetratricopeptide repeat protein [Pseudobacteroides cellulosolvens]KNY25877.1 Tetratricopeptide TPR_1 repeat-containing protein [Pseudobacteroides cellulosolvens ATCC 35603 = DSM 2933]
MTSKEHFEIAEKYYHEYEETQNDELLEKAIKNYSEAIKLQPGFAYAYYKRALIYGIYEEFDNQYQDLNIAINVYSDLIEHDSDNPELHYKLALIHMENFQDNRNKEKSLNHFNKALELGYKNHDIFYNIGEIYCDFPYTRRDEALYYYNKAIDLAPNETKYYLARGECYDLLKQSENAMADFSKGIELAPEDWVFYNRRAELFIQLKEWDKAIDDYKQFRNLYHYNNRLKFELLRNIDRGPFFEFYFEVDLFKHSHWHPDSYYLEDSIMIEFLQVFSTVKEIAFYGYNEYSPSELSILVENFQEHLKLLSNITSYADFFKHVEYSKFLHTLIREFDDIEACWKSILNRLIEITKKLIKLVSNAANKGQYLYIYGI